MMFFLSGLPRSGSTLLAAILNQNPAIRVSATSNLDGLMGSLVAAWESSPRNVEKRNDELHAMLRGVMSARHGDREIYIDKSRAWPDPGIMATMEQVLGAKPKIIATVRDVPDCAASFVRVAKPEDVPTFLRTSGLIGHLKSSYLTLQAGLAAERNNFYVVEFNDLTTNPQWVIEGIYNFLDIEPFSHDFDNVDGSTVKENDDDAWGVPGLHDIRGKVSSVEVLDPHEVLGSLYDEFDQPAFWRADHAERPVKKLDLQLAASLRGDFTEGWKLCRELEDEDPGNDRAAFNRGWYVLREGRLRDGHALLDRGRAASVFGNPKPPTPTPLWDGLPDKTVLLNLEGGRGDQICGLRYVREILSRRSRCIVACSDDLIPIVKSVYGVDAIIASEAAGHVYHDAWMPSMSAPSILGLEYGSLDGSAFIHTPIVARNNRLTIGLRWQGNPQFEHEQHRVFPAQMLFDAVHGIDADFISLQRDDGAEHRPDWVHDVDLSTWKATQEAIACCDLVVSSCTSVAHLAAAMGKRTHIIVPVLPYYLWALPQDTSPWYDNVRLFRQETPGNWTVPFTQLKASLQETACDALEYCI